MTEIYPDRLCSLVREEPANDRWVDSSSGFPQSRQQTRQVNGVNEYTSIDPDGTPPPGKPPNSQPMPLQHDGAGNLTRNPLAVNAGDACGAGIPACGSGQQYEYDEENRVTAIKRASASASGPAGQLLMAYEYDALGRRVHTIEYVDAATGAALATPRKTRHIYISLETVEEYSITQDAQGIDTATLLREFVWGDPRSFPDPVAMIAHNLVGAGFCEPGEPGSPGNECVFHYLHDALGSVVGLTDSTGNAVERYTYDPYGHTLIEDQSAIPIPQSAIGNPWLWTGQRYDAAVGLYAFLFRIYSPESGRWLQRDPADYTTGVNLYEYAMSAPLTWLDRLGLWPADPDMQRSIELLNWLDPSIDTSNASNSFDIFWGTPSMSNTLDAVTQGSKGERYIVINSLYNTNAAKATQLRPKDPNLLGAYLDENTHLIPLVSILAHECYHKNVEGTFWPWRGEPIEAWMQEIRAMLLLINYLDCKAHPKACSAIRLRILQVQMEKNITDAQACGAVFGTAPKGYAYEVSLNGQCELVPLPPPPPTTQAPPAPQPPPGPQAGGEPEKPTGPCG